MNHCAFCRNPLKALSAWREEDGVFYCNEFCADAADDISKTVARRRFESEERATAA
jgi:hypothetical protein